MGSVLSDLPDAERLRLFFAVVPPPDVAEGLDAVAPPAPLRRRYKAVVPESRHITLLFLGDTDRALLEPIGEALAGMPRPDAFTAIVDRVGVFPRPARARVLWAGVRPEGPLGELHAALEEQMVAVAGHEPEDRPFHAHLTLGRWKRPPPAGHLHGWLDEVEAPELEWLVDGIELVASELTPSGPVYHTIFEVGLGAG